MREQRIDVLVSYFLRMSQADQDMLLTLAQGRAEANKTKKANLRLVFSSVASTRQSLFLSSIGGGEDKRATGGG